MTDDKVELSEEKINSDNGMDDDDNDDDNAEEEEEEIPENHSKLVAFHAAIKAVLERQLDKLQLEVNESRKKEMLYLWIQFTFSYSHFF